jgi:hypothetical protein
MTAAGPPTNARYAFIITQQGVPFAAAPTDRFSDCYFWWNKNGAAILRGEKSFEGGKLLGGTAHADGTVQRTVRAGAGFCFVAVWIYGRMLGDVDWLPFICGAD